MAILLALLAGCASADDPDGPLVGELVATQPTATTQPTPATQPTTVDEPAAKANPILRATAASGMSVRSAVDHNFCLERVNNGVTVGTPVWLTVCNSNVAQVWLTYQGLLTYDNNTCLGYSGNDLIMQPCANNNVAWEISGGSWWVCPQVEPRCVDTLSRKLVILPTYASATSILVQALLAYQNSSSTFWDLAGVDANLGTLVSFRGDPNVCLTRVGAGLGGTVCNPANAQQRWQVVAGRLSVANGDCLICNPAAASCSFLPCSQVSNTAANNQTWYITGLSTLYYASKDGNGLYNSIVWDARQQKVVFAPTSQGNYWVWGGYRQ